MLDGDQAANLLENVLTDEPQEFNNIGELWDVAEKVFARPNAFDADSSYLHHHVTTLFLLFCRIKMRRQES